MDKISTKKFENKICNTCKHFHNTKTAQIENYYICSKIKEKITPFDYCGYWKKNK